MKDDEHRQSATECEPGLLYHYTTQAGLLGVLESKSIWATHMLHLNDSSEVRLGIEMFNRCLVGLRVNQRASEFKRGAISAESIPKIERILRESAASAIREMSAAEVFISSFEPLAKSRQRGDLEAGTANFRIGLSGPTPK
jgi:hypothetical protein